MKLFTKTWKNDLGWLAIAVKSVWKHCRDEVEWTIVCDRGERQLLEEMLRDVSAVMETSIPAGTPAARRFQVHEIQEHWPECAQIPRGYEAQQWVKMTAHRVMGNGVFWHFDSDVICIREFSLKDFLGPTGRPILWCTPLQAVVDPVNPQVYFERAKILQQLFGLQTINYEWARCMPLAANGAILRHGSTRPEWQAFFKLCVGSHPYISEFNTMGQFAYLHFPYTFEWWDTRHHTHTWMSHPGNEALKIDGWMNAISDSRALFFQGWSWGGMPEGLKAWAAAS